jgi:hypothetical protein
MLGGPQADHRSAERHLGVIRMRVLGCEKPGVIARRRIGRECGSGGKSGA